MGEPIHRVLVVDDGADDREVLSLQLRSMNLGIEIDLATSGEEALRAMHRRPPDLVLLDILMPSMDGWEVLANKQKEAALRDIPVILVSAEDPQQRPVTSELIVGTIGQGLSLSKLLDCSRELAAMLRKPD
jgi:CheY-like chemotaxis protein